ncbi:MAG: phosphotransferase family protein [Sulfuricaulis sp.]|nr:phosphotransferase family protein [Sulfuricaulis sp.]
MNTNSSRPVDLDALGRWMDQQGLASGPITQPKLLTGGTQNILLHFRRGGRDLVLRRPPLHMRPELSKTMQRESRVLAALAGSDVPHPTLVAECASDQVLGAAFYLMELVDGFNATLGLPSLHANSAAIRHDMGLAMVDAGLALGRFDYVAAGLSDFGKPEGYLERQVVRWQAQLDAYRDYKGWPGAKDIPGVDAVGQWLIENRPASFVPGLMHGDFQLSNALFRFDSGRVAALIDWELSTIGDPLIDFGWLLAGWPIPGQPAAGSLRVEPWDGFPSMQELIARYKAGTQRDMSAFDWYAVLACYKAGIVIEGTYARSCAGKASPELGRQFHASTLSLFQRAHVWIEHGLPQ